MKFHEVSQKIVKPYENSKLPHFQRGSTLKYHEKAYELLLFWRRGRESPKFTYKVAKFGEMLVDLVKCW